MTHRSPFGPLVVGLLAIAGCSSGGGTTFDDASSRTDGGGTIDEGSQFGTLDVDGAREASYAFDEDDGDDIACRIEASTLHVHVAPADASDEGMTLAFAGYAGAGVFSPTASSSPGTTLTVDVAGGYAYAFGTDAGDGTGEPVASRCELIVVDIPTAAGFVDVTLSCRDLAAAVGSPDHGDVDATGYRPRVELAAHVVCDT